MKQIAVLGSTGSIGTSCLDIVEKHGERLRVVALAAHKKWELLAKQASRHKPRWVVINDECVRTKIPRDAFPTETEVLFGEAAVEQIAVTRRSKSSWPASSGRQDSAARGPPWKRAKRVAFANKETLVVAGPLSDGLGRSTAGLAHPRRQRAQRIFQALQAGRRERIAAAWCSPPAAGLSAAIRRPNARRHRRGWRWPIPLGPWDPK